MGRTAIFIFLQTLNLLRLGSVQFELADTGLRVVPCVCVCAYVCEAPHHKQTIEKLSLSHVTPREKYHNQFSYPIHSSNAIQFANTYLFLREIHRIFAGYWFHLAICSIQHVYSKVTTPFRCFSPFAQNNFSFLKGNSH